MCLCACLCFTPGWGGFCSLDAKQFEFPSVFSHQRDERKSRHVTNCTVGITGFEREQTKRGGVWRRPRTCVCVCVWKYEYLCAGCKLSQEVHCFSFMDVEDSDRDERGSLVLSGLPGRVYTSLWETEMPKAYQDQTPASHYYTSRCQSVSPSNFIK